VDGIKADFMSADAKWMMAFYERILQTATEHQLGRLKRDGAGAIDCVTRVIASAAALCGHG
jgi:hypothetical protein